MIKISSQDGRIGEFWWINAQPSNPVVAKDWFPGIQLNLILWGGCGFGRDLKMTFEPLPTTEVEP